MMTMDCYRVGAPVDTLPVYRSYLKVSLRFAFHTHTAEVDVLLLLLLNVVVT